MFSVRGKDVLSLFVSVIVFGSVLLSSRKRSITVPNAKPKQNRPKSRSQKRYPASRQLWWHTPWKVCAAIAGIIVAVAGVASAVLSFWPQLTIEPGGPFDPSSPYPLPFVIRNTGPIPLTNIQPMLGICEIDPELPAHNPVGDCPPGVLKAAFIYRPWFIPRLERAEPYTIYLDEAVRFPSLASANIAIGIDYYPWFLKFWPFKFEMQNRFQTILGSNGKLSWRARPLSK